MNTKELLAEFRRLQAAGRLTENYSAAAVTIRCEGCGVTLTRDRQAGRRATVQDRIAAAQHRRSHD